MDILDRYLGYETQTLRYFLERCRGLSSVQLHQQFDVGLGTIHDTVVHVIANLGIWTDLMRERPVQRHHIAAMPDDYLRQFDAAMADFVACARELAAAGRLDDTYSDVLDDPPTAKTFGGTLLHVLTHTTVHRWEMQHMLQRLGLDHLIEGDALGWEWRVMHHAE